MARDFVNLMQQLGHERFAVVGHDRGAAAAIRLALDHPERVTRLAVLDGLPIGAHLVARTPGSPSPGTTGSSSRARSSPPR